MIYHLQVQANSRRYGELIEYHYNLEGELLYKDLEYRCKDSGFAYVISRYPEDDENKPNKFNTYCLSTIADGCSFEFYHEHNESQLRKYEGKIEEDSPLILLQKFYRGEIELSREMLEKIENNEIILNTKPTFKDIIKF